MNETAILSDATAAGAQFGSRIAEKAVVDLTRGRAFRSQTAAEAVGDFVRNRALCDIENEMPNLPYDTTKISVAWRDGAVAALMLRLKPARRSVIIDPSSVEPELTIAELQQNP